MKLIQYFDSDTGRKLSALDLARGYGDSLKSLMLAMQEDANLGLTQTAPRIALAEKKLGRPLLMKILCALIKMLDYSLSLSFELTPIQVFECAQLFLDKYRAESVQDLVLCLRLLKQGDLRDERGGIVRIYNRLDAAALNEWMWAYANWKIDQLESHRHQQKSEDTRQTSDYVGLLAKKMPDDIRENLSALPSRIKATPDLDLPLPTHEQYVTWLRENAPTLETSVLEEIQQRAAATGNDEVYEITQKALDRRTTSIHDV